MNVSAGVECVATVLPVVEPCVQAHYFLDQPCTFPVSIRGLGMEISFLCVMSLSVSTHILHINIDYMSENSTVLLIINPQRIMPRYRT